MLVKKRGGAKVAFLVRWPDVTRQLIFRVGAPFSCSLVARLVRTVFGLRLSLRCMGGVGMLHTL